MMAHRNPGSVVWLWAAVLAAFTSTAMTQTTLIPDIPASQERSPLANLWRFALSNQKSPSGQVLRSEEPAPKTFAAPSYGEVSNWVPQDSPHPLYSTEFSDLLREILLDYMVVEKVQPDDPRMNQPNGLQVTNLNGKTMTFTSDVTGVKINGISARPETNEDGTVSYTVFQSLFGHREIIHDVWSEYIKVAPLFDPWGRPLTRDGEDPTSTPPIPSDQPLDEGSP